MVMHAGVTGWTDVEREGLKERVSYRDVAYLKTSNVF